MAQGQIEQRGERVFRVRWFQGRDASGKRRYGSKTVRGTRKHAEKALRETLRRQDKGHAVPSPSRVPSLREYTKRWEKGQAAAALRDRTRRDYVMLLERHVLPALGGFRLDAIHAARIEEEVVAPLRAKGHLRTARLAVCALSRVMRSAVKDPTLGLVGNPCEGVEIGRSPRRAIQPLTAEERGRFREAIRGREHEALWLSMMLTCHFPRA